MGVWSNNMDTRTVLVLVLWCLLECHCEDISLDGSRTCQDFYTRGNEYRPNGPRVLCCLLYVAIYKILIK